MPEVAERKPLVFDDLDAVGKANWLPIKGVFEPIDQLQVNLRMQHLGQNSVLAFWGARMSGGVFGGTVEIAFQSLIPGAN